jgi:prevent-host-death family protein
MPTMNATQVRQQWSKILGDVYKEQKRVVVEKSGIPVAGVVSVRDLRRLNELDEQQAADRQLLEALRQPFQAIPPAELEREVAKAVKQARAEIRKEAKATRTTE